VPIFARFGFVTAVLGSVLLVGLVAACSNGEEEAPAPRAPRPLPGSPTSSTGEGDTTPGAATNNGKCEELGSLASATGEARYLNSDVRALSLPLANRAVASKVAVVAVGSRAQLLGADRRSALRQSANYETYALPVIAVGCTTDTAGVVLPADGQATFSAVDAAGETFEGTFDVTLEEVRVDFKTDLDARSKSGASSTCLRLSAVALEAVVPTSSSSGSSTSQAARRRRAAEGDGGSKPSGVDVEQQRRRLGSGRRRRQGGGDLSVTTAAKTI
jgi:hypothetical protein